MYRILDSKEEYSGTFRIKSFKYPWTGEEDKQLRHEMSAAIQLIAKTHKRTRGEILGRLRRHGVNGLPGFINRMERDSQDGKV